MRSAYGLATDKIALNRLDISSAELMQELLAELRAANERQQAVEEYLKSGRGGAVTNASRNRLRREARNRVERARIALADAGAAISRLKRRTDKIEWAEVVG